MQRSAIASLVVLVLDLTAPVGAAAQGLPAFPCAPDAVMAGTLCLDRYEASVWRVPNPTTANADLVTSIQLGMATQADLMAGGATQLGTASNDYAPCANTGQNCTNDIYAVSLPSVLPSAFITWFQAQEACANAGKRLPTSAEWQVGANGTPDPGPDNGTTDCNVGDGAEVVNNALPTGARSSCVSARGAFDMVGNLAEWVADWVPASTDCPGWAGFSNDDMCLAGASTTSTAPGALVRGGAFRFGPRAGPLAVDEAPPDSTTLFSIGFRCAASPLGNQVSGSVQYYASGLPVPDVTIDAVDAGISTSTDSAGNYVLTDLPMGDISVIPEKSGGTGDAVSSLDAAFVLQALIGLRQFSDTQRLACDVTGNGSLSALDAALILQYKVGLISSFPVVTACESDWLFIPSALPEPNQTSIQPQPGQTSCTPGALVYQPLTTSVEQQNFLALVFGDCTGNWQPAASAGRSASARVVAPGVVRAGRPRRTQNGRVEVPLNLSADRPLQAIDIEVHYDARQMRLLQVHRSFAGRHALTAVNSTQPGRVRIALASAEPLPATQSAMFVVSFDSQSRSAISVTSTGE